LPRRSSRRARIPVARAEYADGLPDPDFLDAGLTQAPFLDNREGVGEGPRSVNIATDHQQLAHIGVAAQARQQLLQISGTRKTPCRDVNDGLESGFA
jgi:hypothetical protein